MGINFLLLVNKQGQTRIARYSPDNSRTVEQRRLLEGEIVRKCLSRAPKECSFIEHQGYLVCFRRYASLFFLAGVKKDTANPLAVHEFIHSFVETLDSRYKNVCELDIMFNMETVHHILDELLMNGEALDKNDNSVLDPILQMEKASSLIRT